MRKAAIILSLALMLALAAGAGAQLKPGDKGKFNITQAGNDLGYGTYELTDTADGYALASDTLIIALTGEVKLHTSTSYSTDWKVTGYQLTATLPDGSTQEVTLSFEGGNAQASIHTSQGDQERTIELPEEWVMFDNNIVSHIVLLAATKPSPGMEKLESKALVPQAMSVIDYSVEDSGAAEYEIGTTKHPCQKYRMVLAGRIELFLYIKDGMMLAYEVPGQMASIVREMP